jgi:tripartite-type tricarboxylate transporter receptor subunit TctC
MNRRRRQFLHLAASATALAMVPRIARAQGYPARPVRIIVSAAAGAGNDIVARIMAQWLTERLGQSFFIENRPGAGTNIGTEVVVRAPPDGTTLLLINTSGAVNATLYDKLSFNFIRDIAPVAGIVGVSNVVYVHPSVPVKTIPELVAYAKANPGKLTMASGGSGSSSHMAGELFKLMTGTDMLHVPYRGNAPAFSDLLGGQVNVMFSTTPGTTEFARNGRLRALAVTTRARVDALPDVPVVADFVPGYEASQWYGMGAPRSTPPEIIERLNREINAGLADPGTRAKLADLGGIPIAGSPDDLRKLIANETEKWGRVVRAAGIKAD